MAKSQEGEFKAGGIPGDPSAKTGPLDDSNL
jgi:hypothetical protein